MMWIVRVALERPLTFIVLAILITIAGPMAVMNMPTDIFPSINIPVISVVFQYSGLPPSEMLGRIVTPFERLMTTSVDDIEHVESQSLAGIGMVKIYFQPTADIRTAQAQIAGVAPATIKNMPAGTQPPTIVNYSASNVAVLQVAYSSKVLSEAEVLDQAQNFVRPHLVSVPGLSLALPFGGKSRQISFDLDPEAMAARGLSAGDVQAAVTNQNQIIPAGTAKIGTFQYPVLLNDASASIEEMNNLPVKTVNGATVYMRDIAHVREGSSPQLNVVHVDNSRAVLSSVFKHGNASTLDVVQGVKNMLPQLKELLPPALNINLLDDQSIFVKAAIGGVAREGVIAACLTSLMILLFLGSWRSTVIIAISIPLAVMAALAGLWAAGQTLNIMTLGGLALAVGILVDDATVTIENINWHLEHGKDVKTAILDGAQQIVQPAFVSLLCICIVFVPMFALKGVAGYLFVPMAMSVIFAMIASFVLSRTLVPTMAMYLLRPHQMGALGRQTEGGNALARLQRKFENGIAAVRESYRNLLALAMVRRRLFVTVFMALVLVSFGLVPFLGSDFFPTIDAGQMVLHARLPAGTRLEHTLPEFARIETDVRSVIPNREVDTIIDNIGLSTSPTNVTYNNSGTIGTGDGDILITLKEGHRPTAQYMRRLREKLPRDFPGVTFSFPPADIVGQILNFGAPAPVDVQITGNDLDKTAAFGNRILRQLRTVSGIADARMQQAISEPELRFQADRARIAQVGLTEQNVTTALATALAGTGQTAPNFFLNPKNNVSYNMVTQVPEYREDNMAALQNISVSGGTSPQALGALGRFTRVSTPAVVTQYNVQPTIDLYATVQDRDLAGVTRDVQKIMDQNRKFLPRGSTLVLRGQSVTMNAAFSGLFLGLAGAIVLIYLLIVVNFQSWLDPFVIITALPAALAGIVWMLFSTGTTLSVPALTGAIMCMGVATANSILVVSFARERLAATGDPIRAAVEAGFTRFRPVLMTALAMIIGMAPMALGLGEGGEQNAPLGRAVIGGLIFATAATLMFVPVVFSIVHGRGKAHAQPAPQTGVNSGEVYA